MLSSATFSLAPNDTIREAHAKANNLFPGLLKQAIKKVMKLGRSAGLPQSTGAARYWHQRNDEDGELCCFSMNSRTNLFVYFYRPERLHQELAPGIDIKGSG